MKSTILMCAIVLAFGFSQNVYVNNNEQVRLAPRMLNYQGYLTDTLGIPITNASLSMSFAIFDASSAGNQKWIETQTSVSVNKGIFHVLLGSVTPIPDSVFNNTNRWLELSVATQTLIPRTRIVSAPFAYTSTYSDTAQYARNAAVDNDWVIVGNNQYSGVSGNVGIGTNAPEYKFDVHGIICGGDSNTIYSEFGAVLGGHKNRAGEDGDNSVLVVGGYNNNALHSFSAIVGGRDNYSEYGYNFIGGGYSNYVVAEGATVAGGEYDTILGVYSSVLGGYSNLAGDTYSDIAAAVVGGYDNIASANYAIVGGGQNNKASNECASVVGGNFNTASGYYTTVAGGDSNTCSGYCSIIGGGEHNEVTGGTSILGGGSQNSVSGEMSFMGGGAYNSISDGYSSLVGGSSNVITSRGSFLGVGYGDTVSGLYSSVVGGFGNRTSGEYSIIGSGLQNICFGNYSGVLSGIQNHCGTQQLDTASVICGGYRNFTMDKYSFIGGGWADTVTGVYSFLGGGYGNKTTLNYTSLVGGLYNTTSGAVASVGGGYSNSASGAYSSISGGRCDTTAGFCSFATNNSAKVFASDSNSAAFTTSHTTADNQVRAVAFSTGTVDFAMDHPADPMNKILNQYAVGSDEVTLMYSGSVVLNASGRATVNLPDYFDDINRNPRIQLTGVGSSDVYIAEDIKGNSFKVGGKANVKVYWTVIAERRDIHAEIARIQTPVVQEKTGELRGHSIDDDAMIGMYDGLHQKNPNLFKFKTDEGRRVHEQAKELPAMLERK